MTFFGKYKAWDIDTGDNWRERGLCRDNAEVFFPLNHNDTATREALAICARCEVLVDCSKLTLQLRPAYGVWAQTTERQRANRGMAWNRLLQRAGAL